MSENSKRKFETDKQDGHDIKDLDVSNNQELQKQLHTDEYGVKIENESEDQLLIDIANIKKEINESGYEENPQIKFCVRVEVKEHNEDIKHNIKIEIINLEESNKAQSLNDESRNNQDKLRNEKLTGATLIAPLKIADIDLKQLYDEVNAIASTSTNLADKILAIELKNNWGMVLRHVVDNDPINDKIQDVINNKWKEWISISKYRETPIFYKCYICKKAWWHLEPFRAHLPRHHIDTYQIELEEQLHEANIIAYGTINVPKIQYFKADGECWKCANPFEFHVSSKKQYASYLCRYCEDYFYTCTDLQAHQGVCWQYLKHREIERQEEMKICSLCCCLFPTKEKLKKHLVTRHSVRSDHPVQSQYKICSTCNLRYFIHGVHHCPKKLMNFNCERCNRGFTSTLLVDIHTRLTESNVNCQICGQRLPKKCMETLHYQTHTDQFKMAYKCIICTQMVVYLDEISAKRHKHQVHSTPSHKKRVYFEKVLLPKSYFPEGAVIQKAIVPLGIQTQEIQGDVPVFKTQEVKNSYQAKSNVNPENELNIALTEIKKEMEVDAEVHPGCSATVEEQTLSHDDDLTFEFHEEPLSEEAILQEHIKMEIKSEPMDEENEDDICLSIELPAEPEYELVEAIKQEPEDHLIINEEVEHNEILIPESTHPRLRPMEHKQSKSRYPCSRCNKTFLTAKKYLLHFTTHGIEYMCCPVCLQSFENVTELLPHVTNHVKQTYLKMRVIDKSAPGKKRKHARSKDIYQCKECKSKVEHNHLYSHWDTHFKTGWKRNELDDRVANDMSLQSEGLKMVIKNLVASKKHMLMDCVICHRHFDRKDDSKRHLIEHLLTDAYSNKPLYGALRCQICHMGFEKPNHYKLHMRDHGSLPVYRCEICDRAFSDSSNFTKHKKVHNLQAVICDICSKKFQSKVSLVKHLEMHRTTKPFTCQLCHRVSFTESAYKRHIRKFHDTADMKIKCQLCGKKYGSLKEKWDHLWLVHKERKDKADCLICNKEFRRFIDLKRHIKKDHSVLPARKAGKTDDIEEVLRDNPSLEMTEVQGDVPVFKTQDVKKSYQAKSNVNPENEMNIALTEIKKEKEADGEAHPGCSATVEDQTQSHDDDLTFEFHEEPLSEEVILQEDIKMEIESEPMDEEYEDVICLSIDLPKPDYQLEEPIKQEPEDYMTINEDVEHSETLIPESSHPQLQPMEHKQSKSRYPCSRCNRTFLTAKKYLLHFTTHGIEYMCCPVCLQSFENVTELLPHVTNHVKQTYLKMRVIDKSAPGKKRKHARSKDIYQCKECKSKVEHNHLYSHWDTHFKTGWKRNELDRVANDMLLQSEGLKMVIENLVAGKKNKDCVLCHRHFDKKNDSKRHLIEHLLTDAYSNKPLYGALRCQICHVSFEKPDHYKLHMRDHGSLPVYRCEICDRAFSDSSNFTKHKKVHNLQAVICDICSKKFQSKVSLVKHLEMHRTTKPITCQLCHCVSYTEAAYKRHIRKFHDRANIKIKCQLCGKMYSSMKEKLDHLWLVHKERKDKADCLMCKKEFRMLIDLKRHIKKDHSVLPARKAGKTDDIEEVLRDDASLEMTEVQGDVPVYKTQEVKKSYQTKSEVNPENELKIALTEIKKEMEVDAEVHSGCSATVEEQTLSHEDGTFEFHEEPLGDETILPEDIKTEIKSEPMDKENDDNIICLSIELPAEPEYELVEAIKQEPEDHSIINEEVEHNEILIPESSHPRLQPMEHKQSKSSYPCSRCNKTFLTAKKYLLHFTTHGIEYMCCPVCLQSFENVTELLPHVTNHVKQTYLKMRVIDKSAPGKKRKHARSKDIYQCKECKSKVEHYNLYSHWDTHFKTGWKRNELDDRVANDMSLQSEGLKMVIENLVASKKHMLMDCVICHRHFDRKDDSKRHLIEHLLTDAYSNKPLYGALRCQICHVSFEKPDHYKLHMRDHGSLPVYRCEICDRAFSDSSNFTKHKKVHNLQAVICDICSKKFQSKVSLVKHLEMHRTTKPITCQLCHCVSYSESAYKKHIRKFHDRADIKIKCQLCGKMYSSMKEKLDHLWLVHKERKDKADCLMCKKEFRRLIDLKRHIKKDHSVLPARKARKTGDIEEVLRDDPSLEMTEGETLIVYE